MKNVEMISQEQKLGLKVWTGSLGRHVGQFVMVCKGGSSRTFIIFGWPWSSSTMPWSWPPCAVRESGPSGPRRPAQLRALDGAGRNRDLRAGLRPGGLRHRQLLILLLQKHGIPAGNEFLYFFVAGPKLSQLSAGSLVGAFFLVLFVTCA